MNSQLSVTPTTKRPLLRLETVLILIGVVALTLAPFYFYPIFLMKVLCFALFACAFNLLLGYTGILSFGHAAFFGSSAYFTAHAVKEWGLTPELGILVGVAGAAFLGLIIGFLAIRRQGIYSTMITLALSQMFFLLPAGFVHPRRGRHPEYPARPPVRPDRPGRAAVHVLLRALGVPRRHAADLAGDPFAVRHDPALDPRERKPRDLLGYTVSRYKLGAFVMSAALAGLAGGLKALVFQFATLTDVSWQMSGEVVLMTLLGGIGTLVGPVFGAALVTTLGNYFATSELPVTLVTGIIFMVCVLVFRRGMIGELYASRLGKKLERRAED